MHQVNAVFQLTAGIEESTIRHWFIKPGDIVHSSDPLVTLNLPKKTTLTLRVSPRSQLDGAVLEHIILEKGTSAGANDVLAVFAGTISLPETAIPQPMSPMQGNAPQLLELGVDPIFTPSFSLREVLFKRFPRFHRLYFKTYPLLQIAAMWLIVIVCLLIVPQLLSALTQGSDTSTPVQGNWLLSFIETWLLPFSLFGMLLFTLLWLLSFFLRRFPRRDRSN